MFQRTAVLWLCRDKNGFHHGKPYVWQILLVNFNIKEHQEEAQGKRFNVLTFIPTEGKHVWFDDPEPAFLAAVGNAGIENKVIYSPCPACRRKGIKGWTWEGGDEQC